jgi:glycerol-3-phosphate acyltransferase PlsX
MVSAPASQAAAPAERHDGPIVAGRPVVIAVDAMGGDRAPAAIVAGALDAVGELAGLGVSVLLVGDREQLLPLLPGGDLPDGLALLAATEVIGMAEEPAAAVRAKRDSSVVRCAEAVRDGRAVAMVGAGNTGATMAAALLRCGRIAGVARPAIAVPLPIPGSAKKQLLVDGGATVDPEPEWLVQWARLGRAYARLRLGVDAPTVGLLSNGEEPGKGDRLRKETYERLRGIDGFCGNVEGRDLLRPSADVILTDGFTGNVALKAAEGALLELAGLVFSVLDEPAFADAAAPVKLRLLEAAADLLPDNTGGAMLLGVNGVCVISHGSSSARAIVNAIRLAADCARADLLVSLAMAIEGAH